MENSKKDSPIIKVREECFRNKKDEHFSDISHPSPRGFSQVKKEMPQFSRVSFIE